MTAARICLDCDAELSARTRSDSCRACYLRRKHADYRAAKRSGRLPRRPSGQKRVYGRGWTPARAAAASARMKARHEANLPNYRPPRIYPGLWTDREDAILRRLAGTATVDEMRAAVNAVSAVLRSRNAVQLRLCSRHLDLGQMIRLPDAHVLARQMGVMYLTLQNWQRRGLLVGRRVGPGKHSPWMFDQASVLAFIRNHPEWYDRRKITDRRLAAEAEVVWRADPLLKASAAAAFAGVPVHVIYRAVQAGLLMATRGMSRLWIRRSALIAYRQTCEAAA